MPITTSEEFQALRTAINCALAEAAERDIGLSVADVTLRLLEAYLMGEREPRKLVDAAVFSPACRWLN